MQETPHGFTAKVADFGLSREMQSTVIETRTCGTITHMPPELLSDDVVSKVALHPCPQFHAQTQPLCAWALSAVHHVSLWLFTCANVW